MTDAAAIARELAEAARLGSEALDVALEGRSLPAVGDGWALFVYRGPADAVKLHLWISGGPGARPFQPVDGTDLWMLETELHRGARIEYKLEVVEGDDHRLIQDPLNPRLAHDPFGANSVVHGPGYTAPEWAAEHAATRRGEVVDQRMWSDVFGEERDVSVYLPARFRETLRYPLLVVHDGIDYLRFSGFANVLDNLIHRFEIPSLVVALIQSPNRNVEYAGNEMHARFVVDELVPLLEKRYPLLDNPGERALVGASFGAVAGLHIAWSRPGTFGKLLLQSGSFAFTDIGDHDKGPLFDPVVEFVNAFREDPGRPADQVFLSSGTYESAIYFNRSLLPVLQGTGADVRLVEAQDGHNWENWRDRLRDGLSWLFPGPLWMVYE
jgi:enterochelin esterase family protein